MSNLENMIIGAAVAFSGTLLSYFDTLLNEEIGSPKLNFVLLYGLFLALLGGGLVYLHLSGGNVSIDGLLAANIGASAPALLRHITPLIPIGNSRFDN